MAYAQPQISCNRCGSTFDLETAFDACDESWPAREWIFFTCPTCESHWILESSDCLVVVGEANEFPDPIFDEVARVPAPGLWVRLEADGMRVGLGRREWFFPEM